MTKNADRLLREALQLDASDRAKVAAELLASLDDRQTGDPGGLGRRDRPAGSGR